MIGMDALRSQNDEDLANSRAYYEQRSKQIGRGWTKADRASKPVVELMLDACIREQQRRASLLRPNPTEG